SRLMGDDEEATVRTLTAYREVLSTLIQQHNGKVLDSPGDNLLAEFVSVVDAVQCAVAVQKEIKARNDQLPENRRMQFRIGINLGDVIQEEERIYGDGVNIAARLESLANPGGICISKTAFDQIESKLPYGYEFLGDQTVKNIAKPVSAYRVLMEPRVTVAGEPEKEKRSPVRRMPILVGAAAVLMLGVAIGIWQYYARRPSVEPASQEKMAFPLPDKPSIAVLPFDNIGGDPEQEYFSDGLAENIITQLSQIHSLFVISRSSSFTYKGKPVKVNQVAEELGVRYVLEGSVQRAENRVRVTAQLIDASTGRHLWADRYDRELTSIFAIQDEITRKIITEMAVKLGEGEHERLLQKQTQNVEAWTSIRRGIKQFRQFTKEANLKARELSEKAISLEPEYSEAYSLLGWTYALPVRQGWSKSPKEDLKRAEELVYKAKDFDKNNSMAQDLLGFIYVLRGQYDRAIQEGQRSVELAPNTSDTHALLSLSFLFNGQPDAAVAAMLKAMRLAPFYPRWFLSSLAESYFVAGQYEEAEAAFKKILEKRPQHFRSHAWLAVIYKVFGRDDLARRQAEQALRINPAFCTEEWRKEFTPWKNREEVERILDIARKSGIPEKPPQKASN
ncbi:MAG: tetratricopeptide repeat protein, partial [Planctomycetota bacterium]